LEYGESFIHEREVYTLVDCLGDLGGLIEIIFFTAMTFIHPISLHSYTLNMIKKLFIGRTSDGTLFKKPRMILKGDEFEK
jgi:hypothetical protein